MLGSLRGIYSPEFKILTSFYVNNPDIEIWFKYDEGQERSACMSWQKNNAFRRTGQGSLKSLGLN